MYCCKCGVALEATEKFCPLCGTQAYHPQLPQQGERPLYPQGRYPESHRRSRGGAVFLTAVFVLAGLFSLLCDLPANGSLTWSPLVAGGLLTLYVWAVLPMWFRRPNPVIFVPCGFAAGAGYLLYIEYFTGGHWFLPFALPVTATLGLLVTALVTVLWYVAKGRLFTVGGFIMALGAFMLLLEALLRYTFPGETVHGWSLYPMTGLFLLGGFLIFLGICRPAREALRRKFFF